MKKFQYLKMLAKQNRDLSFDAITVTDAVFGAEFIPYAPGSTPVEPSPMVATNWLERKKRKRKNS